MLEMIDFLTAEKMDKEEYKLCSEQLKTDLILLEQQVKQSKLPVIILFEGWSAAGKGSVIGKTISCLDPRSYRVHSVVDATETEKRMPLMWRFWKTIPEKGNFAIYDQSWYHEVIPVAMEEKLSEEEKLARLDKINLFEKQLSDDGYLIIKFFLHIGAAEQKRRFRKLLDCVDTNWRITDRDMRSNRKYDGYYAEYDNMLRYTNTEFAPWCVVNAENKYMTAVTVFKTISYAITQALQGAPLEYGKNERKLFPRENFAIIPKPPLSFIKLDKTIDDDVYNTELKAQQKRLSKLHSRLYSRKNSVIICFEGWDAAGKGGTIRRVASALDPRGFEAIPICAPEKHELNRHYLWRFWNNMPKSGHIAIFDRTWYGRVMVERIEGFTPEKRWKQAYQEINEFENELYNEEILILKFWLHISKDEQLRRFNDRMNTPEKRWKITDEDWRNREKWDKYESAVEEMITRTSTDFAPWHIIENEDKKYGRLRTLNIINNAIESWLAK